MSDAEPGGALIFDVQVVPRASREQVGPRVGERVSVHVSAPPVDGAANEALRSLLGKAFGIARGKITILRGQTGRKKTVRVEGATSAQLAALLAEMP